MTQLQTAPVSSAVPNALEELRQAIKRREPVKASGLIDHWDACRWTFDGLRRVAGDHRVTAMLGLPGNGALNDIQQSYEQTLTLAEFLDHAERATPGNACYLGYQRLAGLIPGYERACNFEALTGASATGSDTRLWIGSAWTCSGLHSDLKDNIFAQIYGSKRVVLVPFRQTPLVYPYIDNIVNSRVDPERFSADQFPRFLRARIYVTTVWPGEVLYIPRGWWHYLKSESPSISANHWFGSPIPSSHFMLMLLRLGPRYIGRTLLDMIRYSMLGHAYRKDFFFTPPSTGERLYNLLRHGNFSRDNDPATER
jgi:lysine-specific demethylase 8